MNWVSSDNAQCDYIFAANLISYVYESWNNFVSLPLHIHSTANYRTWVEMYRISRGSASLAFAVCSQNGVKIFSDAVREQNVGVFFFHPRANMRREIFWNVRSENWVNFKPVVSYWLDGWGNCWRSLRSFLLLKK